MQKPEPLPKFDNPPVVEVALSIMFESLPGFTAGHAGLLWREYPEFPVIEEYPELGLPIESPESESRPQRPELSFLEKPKLRTWYVAKDGTRLIQVQHNRLVFNWRRAKALEAYPSYTAVRSGLTQALQPLERFIAKKNLGALTPIQCEVAYVNHISADDSRVLPRVSEVLRIWSPPTPGGFLPSIEDARLGTRYVMASESGQFLGRFIVDVQPSLLKSTGEPLLALNLTARGRPLEPGLDGALQFLDLGHEWIVRGFAELTTPEMHSKWRRRQ